MIRTLLAFPGRCRHAVACLALVFLLSPAALIAQNGNIVPGTTERDSVVMRTTFYFSPGNGEWIERSDYPKSGRLVRWAEANPDARIVITGWADASGREVLNDTLSLRRARTVRRYLVRKGSPAERITYAGAGVDAQAATDDEARRADVCAVVLFAAEPETTEPETGQAALSVPTSEITPSKQQPTQTTPEKETRQPEKQAVEEAVTQPTQQQPEQTATPPVQEPKSPVAAIPAKEVSPATPPDRCSPDRCNPVLRALPRRQDQPCGMGGYDSERRRRCSGRPSLVGGTSDTLVSVVRQRQTCREDLYRAARSPLLAIETRQGAFLRRSCTRRLVQCEVEPRPLSGHRPSALGRRYQLRLSAAL